MDGIYLVNKPASMTSFDVVYKIRKALGIRSVGHTGTLDPQATGVLVILCGKATKALPYLSGEAKEYVAELTLGIRTDTGDIWGKTVETREIPQFDENRVREALNHFLGQTMQLPPMVSAIKKNGRKLYEYAREGVEIERERRPIEITEIELLRLRPVLRFRVVCSAGTYVRSLCEDIAQQLATVGTMSSLVRTRACGYSLTQCQSLDDILAGKGQPVSLREALAARWPWIEVDEVQQAAIRNGKKIRLNHQADTLAALTSGEALAMLKRQDDGLYRVLRGLW